MLRHYKEKRKPRWHYAAWRPLGEGEAVAGGLLERADAIAEGRRGGVKGLRLFNFGDEVGADDGGVGKAAENGNMARKRDPEADRDGKLRDAAGAAQERGQIVGQGILRAGDAGAGNEIEKTGGAGRDFREAVVSRRGCAEEDGIEMMSGENASIVFGFFGREIRDKDAIGPGECGGGRKFFETHLEDGIVVAEKNERDLR